MSIRRRPLYPLSYGGDRINGTRELEVRRRDECAPPAYCAPHGDGAPHQGQGRPRGGEGSSGPRRAGSDGATAVHRARAVRPGRLPRRSVLSRPGEVSDGDKRAASSSQFRSIVGGSPWHPTTARCRETRSTSSPSTAPTPRRPTTSTRATLVRRSTLRHRAEPGTVRRLRVLPGVRRCLVFPPPAYTGRARAP